MPFYNWFVKNFVMKPIMSSTKRPVFTKLSELEKSQWWSRHELEDLQAKRLRALIEYAYKHVPYYRDVMKQRNLLPEDITAPSDLKKLPILTKDIIRANKDRILSDQFSSIPKVSDSTGGSSGEPLRYWLDLDSWAVSIATRYRGWGMAGYRFGDRLASIGGSALFSSKKDRRAEYFHMLERNTMLSGIELSDEVLAEHTKTILKKKPKYIYGYTSALYLWAEYVIKNSINIDFVTAVFPTSEMLYQKYRVSIEKGFRCKVFDGYGSRDAKITGFECLQHNGWHLSIEVCVPEIIDMTTARDSNGIGELIVTNLVNYSMPMIRYQVGDTASMSREECPCGRGLPMIKELGGRTSEIFRFDNGKTVTGPAFTVLFSKLAFSQYQIRQIDGMSVLVVAVKSNEYSDTDTDTETALNTIKNHLGEGIQVSIQYVSEIPTTKAGKRLYFINENT